MKEGSQEYYVYVSPQVAYLNMIKQTESVSIMIIYPWPFRTNTTKLYYKHCLFC